MHRLIISALGAAALLASTNAASAQDSEPTLEQTIDYIERNCTRGLEVDSSGFEILRNTSDIEISTNGDMRIETVERDGDEQTTSAISGSLQQIARAASGDSEPALMILRCASGECFSATETWSVPGHRETETDTKSYAEFSCRNGTRVETAFIHLIALLNEGYSDDMFAPAN